jgi:hypothetical protein
VVAEDHGFSTNGVSDSPIHESDPALQIAGTSTCFPLMPHSTSLTDCLWIAGITLAIASIRYALGRGGWFSLSEARQLSEYCSRREPDRTIEPENATRAVGQFYRRPFSFFIFWMPLAGYGAGSIGVSLLRDAGVDIFPWPIVFNSLLLGIGLFLARVLKVRCLSRLAVKR